MGDLKSKGTPHCSSDHLKFCVRHIGLIYHNYIWENFDEIYGVRTYKLPKIYYIMSMQRNSSEKKIGPRPMSRKTNNVAVLADQGLYKVSFFEFIGT